MNEYVNNQLKEKIFHDTSNHGIEVYYMPKENYSKQYAIFSTNYGSIDNKFKPINEEEIIEVPEGIAHFLEHKLFEEPDKNIFDLYSKLGVDVNAFTSFNQTSYIFSSDENFYEALENLIEFVQNPYLTDENVEKEKGIIAEEIKMYDDNPGWKVFFNLLDALYVNHPVKIDIAGTVDTIQEIDKDILYRTYNTFYHPSNMVLFLIGDLDFKEIMDVVNKVEKDVPEIQEIVRGEIKEPEGINKKKVVEEMIVPNPLFYIGFKERDLGYKGSRKIKRDLVTDILLDSLFSSSSKFYNDLYGEGLIDSSFSASYSGDETYGHSVIAGQTENPEEVYDRIKEYLGKDPRSIIDLETFNRTKNKKMGRFIMGFNSIEAIANNFVDMYFDEFALLEVLDIMEEIEYEDVIKRFKEHLDIEYSAISIIKPKVSK